MKQTPTGIVFPDKSGAENLACPFHPAASLHYNRDGIDCSAECIPIKMGMDYIRLELLIDSLHCPTFEFENQPLLVGFISKGWAKIQLSNQDIVKLEPGQCFVYSSSQLFIDRTSTNNVCIEIIRCSQQFVQSLLEFGMLTEKQVELLLSANESSEVPFHSTAMQPDTLQCSKQLTQSGQGKLKNRLGLEANALAWISTVLSQPSAPPPQRSASINATDRQAIQKITDLIDNDPSYEYSLSELCSFAAINEHKLKSAFKAIHNKTAFSYLREKRMLLAAKLLREDRTSVIEIANLVGYTNASHFARAFKNQHGLLPKAYQCLNR